jgi:hypothetical protein
MLLLAISGIPSTTGQQQGPQEGLLTPWESKTVLSNAQKQIRAVSDSLGKIDTQTWKGDYQPLLVSTRQRITAVADAVSRMSEKPESLSLGVEAFLSMEHVEENIESLARGAERFQPSAVASLDNASSAFEDVKQQFQNYLLELSRYLEKNVAVASKDLESCRDQMWKRPPAGKKSN